MRRKSFLLILGFFAVCWLPLAQADDKVLWPMTSGDMFEIVNGQFRGPFEMNRDYSYEYSAPDTLHEKFSHVLEVSASEGKSRIFDLMSVVPGTSHGSHLWTSTHLGYDPMGTSGQLTGREVTDALVCSADGDNRYGSHMNTGFSAAITKGAVHANTTVDPAMLGYDFSAKGNAEVSVGAVVNTAHGDSERIYGQQNYSQHINASGDIDKFSYSAEFSSGNQGSLCGAGAWQ